MTYEISENFESYLNNEPIFNSTWSDWNNSGNISMKASSSNSLSGNISGVIPGDNTTDVVLNLGNKVSGIWELIFWILIPNNKTGYLNIQGAVPIVNGEWLAHIYFNTEQGNVNTYNNEYAFTFPHDTWFEVKMVFNISQGISNATWQLNINNNIIISPNTSLKKDNDGNPPTSLGGINLYSDEETNTLFIDNVYYKDITLPLPVCFPKGTPVTTDQGDIDIDKLNCDKHTIRGKRIVSITQTRDLRKYIVCINKNALSKNVPSQTTKISMNHMVFYKGKMRKAEDLVELCENVFFILYNGETLYNVLLDKHDMMMINNLICETLSPDNILAKIINSKLSGSEINKIYTELTNVIMENDFVGYNKLKKLLC